MKKLTHLKHSNAPEKKSADSSDESVAEWIAMYWSVSKRFRNNIKGHLKSVQQN